MKKVKFIWKNYSGDKLTIGKVYDVISYSINDRIEIMNDHGTNQLFYLNKDFYIIYFKDVTTEYRNEIIDGILK